MNYKRTGRGSSVTSTSLIGGVSDRQRVKLRYVMVSAFTSLTTTGAFSYAFSGNGLFDPDVTGTGGQPANFDDWSALYSRYRVWGSRLKVNIVPNVNATDPTIWVIGPAHVSTAISLATQPDFQAQPYTQARVLTLYTTGEPRCTFTQNMTTSKYLGLSQTEFEGRDDLAALTSANPAKQWYWKITATNVDTTGTTDLCINVEIDYDVEFWDRVDTTLDAVSAMERRVRQNLSFLQQQRLKPDLESKSGKISRVSSRVEDPIPALEELLYMFKTSSAAAPQEEGKVRADHRGNLRPTEVLVRNNKRPSQISTPDSVDTYVAVNNPSPGGTELKPVAPGRTPSSTSRGVSRAHPLQ